MNETNRLQREAGPGTDAHGANGAPLLGFNTLLKAGGLDPSEVRLVRHQDTRVRTRRTLYRIWRDDPAVFEAYQRRQQPSRRAWLDAPYWASFVAAPDGGTLFVGLYAVEGRTSDSSPHINPLSGETVTRDNDVYALALIERFQPLAGLLVIDWGPGTRVWSQRADRQDKPILELRRQFKEPGFPGYAAFMAQLSELENLPASWATALSSCGGVYLLTCPRTNEQYVGAAYGEGGFLGRWLGYVRSGHGGNVGLKIREPSDYRVSILEVAGSAASIEDILAMEARWKDKLQSREMGLNRN